MAQKSRFIIKAMPANGLESLLTMMKRSKKQIGLTVRAPTLSLKGVTNDFINTMMDLPNIMGLDLSEWNLPISAQTKLVQMTNLRQLSMQYPEVTLSPLKNLTKLKLKLEYKSGLSAREVDLQWQSLTNLQDLHIRFMSPHRIEDLTCLLNLTKLHLECLYSDTSTTVTLTAFSKLKDLNISSSEQNRPRYPIIKLILTASCTTLESFYIDVHTEVDFNWLSLNTRLTQYHVKVDLADDLLEKLLPLTKLTNIASARFPNNATERIFGSQKIKALRIDCYQEASANEIGIRHISLLESLHCNAFSAEPASFPNLTKLTCGYCCSPPSSLKVLDSLAYVESMTQLSKLESWRQGIDRGKPILDFEARYLRHLTRIEFSFIGPRDPVIMLPKLSNLFPLKQLEIWTWSKSVALQKEDSEFLITLTNLEALVMPSLNVPEQVFDKIVHLHTQLTQLRINCSESSGEILTQLTNLQVLGFYSSKPMKGLKVILEEKMPRLVEEVRVT